MTNMVPKIDSHQQRSQPQRAPATHRQTRRTGVVEQESTVTAALTDDLVNIYLHPWAAFNTDTLRVTNNVLLHHEDVRLKDQEDEYQLPTLLDWYSDSGF